MHLSKFSGLLGAIEISVAREEFRGCLLYGSHFLLGDCFSIFDQIIDILLLLRLAIVFDES